MSRSALALAIPPGQQPGFDILIHQPRDAAEILYRKAILHDIGTPSERMAMEKMLWLRPLDPGDYRLAHSFLEKLQDQGIKGEGTQLAQSHYLLELLSPDSDPHGLVKRLRSAGLSTRLRTTPMPEVLDDHLGKLLVVLSARLKDAANEGDALRVRQLIEAVENITQADGMFRRTPRPTPLTVFDPIRGPNVSKNQWEQFDHLASSPLMNVALMPLGVAEHILASVMMGELSWEESLDEALDVFGGSVVVGSSIWGTAAAWNSLTRVTADKKLGEILRKISERAPPKLKAYLVPALFLSAFTFVALRESQELPLEESGEYRWNFLEEMAESFGVQIAATGGFFWGMRWGLGRIGRIPKGKIGAGGVLAIATGAGMLAQEVFSGWRRQQFRRELKVDTYRELIALLETYPLYPDHLKPKLQISIDRKLSMLIALNILDFPSIQEAIRSAEAQEKKLARLTNMGFPKERAIRIVHHSETLTPLSETESQIAERWIQKLSGKEGTSTLPVSMLPAQKRRIMALWQNDLSDVIQFMVHPVPITQPSADWNITHTMALLRRYLTLRAS